MFDPLKRLLLGLPLPSSQAPRERLTKVAGLAVLSSDAVSSVAYATDAMLAVLVPAGLVAVSATRPLAFLIAALLIVVTFSYRQTIHAYPRGGGVTLEILESPYRSLVEPILEYLQKVEAEASDRLITVVLPEVIPHRWWQTLLHTRWSVQLRSALVSRPRVTVLTTVAWPLAE